MTRINPLNPLAPKGRNVESMPNPTKDEQLADAIYRAMLKALLKGNPEVFAVLADRAFGKLTLKVEIPGMEDLAAEIARMVIVECLRYLRGKPKGRREWMTIWPVESPAMKSLPLNT